MLIVEIRHYYFYYFFFFKQKTAYEIKECDWSSDVCSSDLKLLKDGYKEGKFLKYLDKETEEDFKKRCENYYKPFNNLKVKCVLDIPKIGLLGDRKSVV